METTLSQPSIATATQQISTLRRVGLVMTYNQKETCIEAINSLLAQTLALDLIIVSDDCSTDGTYGVITDHFSKNGKPSNVELYQSEKNLGFIPHFNALLKNHCKNDDLIFYNAGDDISEPSRVEEFYREYVTQGKPRHFLGHSYVTSFGSGTEEILVPPIESIKENRELCLIASAYHIGASQVFTGALFFDFGPILFDDCYEDLTLGYRALLKDAYHFIPKALLRYRVGGLSSWQKNPLEKKRGRLKSTLTQRAIDSIRSGNFEALTSIQDCYLQYGFSHKPHPDKIKISVVADLARPSYSIFESFETLHNVCDLETVTSEHFLGDLMPSKPDKSDQLIWLPAQQLSMTTIINLIDKLKASKSRKVVLDLGLPIEKWGSTAVNDTLKLALYFLRSLSNGKVHSSCSFFFQKLTEVCDANQITYAPPLQYIDSNDPEFNVNKSMRGLIIAYSCSTESLNALTAINAENNTGLTTIPMDILMQRETSELINFFNKSKSFGFTPKNSTDINMLDYDFIVLTGESSSEHHDLIQYWWSLGAKYCLPTFLNAGVTSSITLRHGESCLFVESKTSSWGVALNLIRSNRKALRLIAKEARRRAYFEHSIQKNLGTIKTVLAKCLDKTRFFDKLLPL